MTFPPLRRNRACVIINSIPSRLLRSCTREREFQRLSVRCVSTVALSDKEWDFTSGQPRFSQGDSYSVGWKKEPMSQSMNAAPENYRTRFERDGVVYPISALSKEKTSIYIDFFSQLEVLLGRPIKRMGNPALYFSWAYRLATEPRVLDAVEAILGPDLLISGTLIFCAKLTA